MRITNNTISEGIVRQIQLLGSQQSKFQTQVATGQKLAQPEDDPTAVKRVLDYSSEQRRIAQYLRNAERALEVSQVSFSGLQQVKKISDRATEIGTLASSAIGIDSARAYASEVNQLIEQTIQLGNTRFREDYIFAGTATGSAPFTATRDAQGRATTVAYAGNTGRSEIPLSDTATLTPGTDASTNTGIADFLNQMIALRDALEAGNSTGVTTAQAGMLSSENVLVSALAEQGGVQSRIEANQSQQQSRADNLDSLIAGETETDLPATIVRLNQTQTAYQAALQSAANIMRLSLLDYIR